MLASHKEFLDLWEDANSGLPEVADAERRVGELKGTDHLRSAKESHP